jgi:Na+-translocating membrane potential-generating system (MpsC)
MVLLEQTLTKGEQVLVDKGRGENVLALRREYQEAMREEASAKVAEITRRNVLAMMSANPLDPISPSSCSSSTAEPKTTCQRRPPGSDLSPSTRGITVRRAAGLGNGEIATAMSRRPSGAIPLAFRDFSAESQGFRPQAQRRQMRFGRALRKLASALAERWIVAKGAARRTAAEPQRSCPAPSERS